MRRGPAYSLLTVTTSTISGTSLDENRVVIFEVRRLGEALLVRVQALIVLAETGHSLQFKPG